MPPTQRRRRILDILDEQTCVSIAYLQTTLDTTPMTLWRDLKLLEDQALLKRIRGGAMKIDVEQEPRYDSKLESSRTAKVKIAKYAIQHMVQDGDIITLEGGTTVAEFARYLPQSNLVIHTNSLPIMNLVNHPRRSVYCSGGLVREESGTMVGKEAVTFFYRRKVKTFFMSATGFDLQNGLTDPNPMEIEVKQAMANSAEQIVLLLDSEKIGITSLMQIIPLRKVTCIVTDKALNNDYTQLLNKYKITQHIICKT